MHNKFTISACNPLQFSSTMLDTVLESIIQTINPYSIIKHACTIQKNNFIVRDTSGNLHTYDISGYRDILLIGIGKACAPLASYCIQLFGRDISKSLLVVKEGYQKELEGVSYIISGHPIPDKNSILAGEKITDMVKDSDSDTLILFLITGGGSSLLELPKSGISLNDLCRFNKLLLHGGLSIQEINTLRTAISEIKGGKLGQIAYPATIISLILSDVPGNGIETIASGPTAVTKSNRPDALDVINKYNLAAKTPENILKTLKQQSIKFSHKQKTRHIHNHLIGSNNIILEGLREIAENNNFLSKVVTDRLSGTIEKNIVMFEQILEKIPNKKVCLIAGGESEVSVTSKYPAGGRNTHFALVFAYEFYEKFTNRNIHFISFATDGTDGKTDSAGAAVSMNHIRMNIKRSEIAKHMKNFTSYNFFNEIGGLIKTGPTMSNFMDIQVLIAE